MPTSSNRSMGRKVAALEAAARGRARDLQAALDQRTALIHELDHRVKNNLQLISALMLMQARRSSDPAVRDAFDAMQRRLQAIGAVHRQLFRAEDVATFDVALFVRDLVEDLMADAGAGVRVEWDLSPVEAPALIAAPLALTVNELVCNALRHAFPDGRPGRLLVSVGERDGALRIEIADDGVGMVEPVSSGGFGLIVVEMLARQLQARIRRTIGSGGVRTEVVAPLARARLG